MLFNGRSLDGWKLTWPGAVNGWSAKDGLLVNAVVQEPGKPPKPYGNLRTEREFEDFRIALEVNVPPEGNSGVYLRGIYEVQVLDSFGKPVDCHNMGAIYGRITPSEAAEKPAGQWQTLDITLVDRHATVILNGKKIIDNQPLLGCTGGALWSDQFRPGPIYLQGDHTGTAIGTSCCGRWSSRRPAATGSRRTVLSSRVAGEGPAGAIRRLPLTTPPRWPRAPCAGR